ncbi:MAG: caspase family protein [Bacteroidia bacterium]|nr:caspase family protein [Bacteroidia bacterium]
MSQKPALYALIIGVNEYPQGIPPLGGCVNDAKALEAFLRDTYADDFSLNLAVLLNGDATREAVIGQFRTFLSRAGKGDTVFFHYSGHGSREQAPPEFKALAPSGKNETLVLSDSRKPGGLDLADKELAVLLHEVARKEPHLVVSMDSCHSGNVTRSTDDFRLGAKRQAEREGHTRSLDSYIDGYYTRQLREQGGLDVPLSRHILLAACDKTESAHETTDSRGLFTSSMQRVLAVSGKDISYADLFLRTRIVIRQASDNQSPQFETYEYFNSRERFLTGRAAAKDAGRKLYFLPGKGGWIMDYGILQGLPADGAQPVTLDIYPERGAAEEPLGHGKVTAVYPGRSVIEPQIQLDQRFTYEARITSLPQPPMAVQLQGDADGVQRFEAYLAGHPEFPFTPAAQADYTITAEAPFTYLLHHQPSGLMIQGARGAGAWDETSVQHLCETLQSVYAWHRVRSLHNRQPVSLQPDDVQLLYLERLAGQEIEHEGTALVDCLEEKRPDGKTAWTSSYALKVRNRSSLKLHFALYYLPPDYRIQLFPGIGTFDLEAGQEQLLYQGKASVPDPLNQTTNFLKLLVSTEPIDGFLLEQAKIDLGKIVNGRTRSLFADEPATPAEDWMAKDLEITLVRRQAEVSAQRVTLAGGTVEVEGHAALAAKLTVQSLTTGTRSDKMSIIPSLLQHTGMKPVSLSKQEGQHDILELHDLVNPQSVTPEQPLHLKLKGLLNPGEWTLPLTFDGQDIIPAGPPVQADADGSASVQIHQLPEEQVKTRSLGSALKLTFGKLAYQAPDTELFRLRQVTFAAGKPVMQELNPLQVLQAQKILVLVHGIIGDTESIAAASAVAEAMKSPERPGGYDCVLAFDYENLNTPIRQIALKFKEALWRAGLNEQTIVSRPGWELHILAHSMGGLVSRWFIEREGGHQLVRRLILCGTPNGGSPFASIAPYIEVMQAGLMFALNIPGLSRLLPWVTAFTGAFSSRPHDELTQTLSEMHPDQSDFLRDLNSSPDPGVPYIILAGDTSRYQQTELDFFKRLMDKAQVKVGQYFNDGTPNDIAVATASILNIPDQRHPAPEKVPIPCHHMNYFWFGPSIEALRRALQ